MYTDNPFIGQVVPWALDFAPRDWAFCDGQLLAINDNDALFSILGTIYGGDGRVTFRLPDLRSRHPIHAGNGPGLNDIRLGQKGGQDTVSLSTAQLPAHGHDANLALGAGPGETAAGQSQYLAANANGPSVYTDAAPGSANLRAGDSNSTGGGQGVNTRQPYLGIRYIIALSGTFPSRS